MDDQDNIAPVHHHVTSDTGNIGTSTGGLSSGTGYASNAGYGSTSDYTSGTNYNSGSGAGYNSTSDYSSGLGAGAGSTGYGSSTDFTPNTTQPLNTSSDYTNTSNYDTQPSTTNDTLDTDRRGSTLENYTGTKSDMVETARDDLGTTQGPFNETVLQQEGAGGGVPSSVGSQDAPGTGGKIGEAAMGALGYGGTHVERPKEQQGIAEKIVNFLGV